jgi:diguanylate cyclase (GGDEF)-like protein
MKRACRAELSARAQLAFETLKEVVAKTGLQVHEQLADDTRHWLNEAIDDQTIELATRLSNELSHLGLGGGDLAVQEERDHLRIELAAEVDLYLATLGRQRSGTGASGAAASGERDHLTQLLGRAAFDSVIREHCTHATEEQPVSLILADIDHFKSVNDNHGHPIGDKVLGEAAIRFGLVVQTKGHAFRYGGEEFAAILPNHSPDEALVVAERARLAIENAKIDSLSITCSFGVATVPVHASSPDQLLEKADQALYDAKRLGRNLVRLYGEPQPEQPSTTRPLRKPATAGGLSDETKEQMRIQIVRGGIVQCPVDDIPLDVIDATTMEDLGRSFLVHCPGCGFQSDLPARKRAV